MNFPQTPDLSQMKCWPLCGFAPGGYIHARCSDCNKDFMGDKRATQCLECAIKTAQRNVSKLDEDLKGMSLAMREMSERPDSERIVAAAIYFGMIFSLPAPARHHTILNSIALVLGGSMVLPPQTQGFLTSTGRFVNRIEAYSIAHREGQIIKKTGDTNTPELFSEDLW